MLNYYSIKFQLLSPMPEEFISISPNLYSKLWHFAIPVILRMYHKVAQI